MSVDMQLNRYEIEEYVKQPVGEAEWDPRLDVLSIVIFLAEALKRGSHPDCKYRIRNRSHLRYERKGKMIRQDLIPLVKGVAELREIAHQKADNKTLAFQELEKTVEYTTLQKVKESFEDTICDLEDAEKELKSASLAFYEETKEKKPIEKVEIKIFKKLEYDLREALKWCLINAQALLVVDKKPFQKVAVQMGAPVEVTEEARCTIGTDLSAYLKQTEEVKGNGQK